MMKVRICVVSRDILELRPLRQILLDPDNNDKVDTDIETFTSLKMSDLVRRHNLSEDLSSQIQAQLLQKAEGTFPWIGYAVNELLTKATTVQVLEAPEELPTALPSLYSRMIRNIPVEKLHTCISILRWVALAVRTLTVHELADAVEWHVPSELTPDQAAQDYISMCKSLIFLQCGRVVLVHQSVKDYLLRTHPDDDPLVESVRVKKAESHLAMADRCIKVLAGDSALVDYANLYWPEHAKQCGKLASPWILANDHFFGRGSETRKNWWHFYEKGPHGHRLMDYGRNPPKLHMACSIGFTQWVEDILSSKRWLLKPWKRSINHSNSRKGLATPLHLAVHGFHPETVEHLLAMGADPNRKFRKLWSAFQWLIKLLYKFPTGYSILERMLACGADVNHLLAGAIHKRDFRLLELAIKHHASLNLPIEGRFGTARQLMCLNRAVQDWNSDDDGTAMIRRLLEAGADPSMRDKEGKTAIQHARCNNRSMAGRLEDERPKLDEEKLRAITGLFKEYGYSDV
jgi:hypothetical protein